jgi:hypothetical protein
MLLMQKNQKKINASNAKRKLRALLQLNVGFATYFSVETMLSQNNTAAT